MQAIYSICKAKYEIFESTANCFLNFMSFMPQFMSVGQLRQRAKKVEWPQTHASISIIHEELSD